ncbi:MAG: hypothetical protein JNM36_04830 [Chitinophagales bacterium]|nr:hypothetical protein [Chitinophagales bacterium]
MTQELLPIPYDIVWKDSITDFAPEFIDYFLPKLYRDIDWSKGYEFLEQELIEILQTEFPEYKLTDKLIKVYLYSGEEKWILIHIEIQSYFSTQFSEQMFRYCQLLMTRYKRQDITALAVFTGSKIPRNFQKYEWNHYGTRLLYEYNTYCIIRQHPADLEKSKNPFALFVLANYYVLKTKKEYHKRLTFKEKMVELLVLNGYDEKYITKFMLFINYIMILPKPLEDEFKQSIQTLIHKPIIMEHMPITHHSILLINDLYGGRLSDQPAVKMAKLEAALEAKDEQLAIAEKEIQQAEKKAQQVAAAAEKKAQQVAAAAEKKERELKQQYLVDKIRLLYVEIQWDCAKIAQYLNLEPKYVAKIIKQIS